MGVDIGKGDCLGWGRDYVSLPERPEAFIDIRRVLACLLALPRVANDSDV